ncbi:outer membrane usher protein FimD/PapC [Serratia fonticola]|uniref:Outer membrane usher protein FimD/PapC n=1 Tax=Serratia fonticola TaxID=47917 RepID=A0A542BST7_SERFO|nr:fimbrial biogenesis usher protein [Serratia fonticola]TQI81642.1 outer membrane usher protein FimD/PapC [Serratia fonticola]TQI96334.1 outer membrane usher protein FimD/PapC [Serratia fonticola]TVZ70832.1 outer membrane usher protein FimD/PapC [Serratia fonticola]
MVIQIQQFQRRLLNTTLGLTFIVLFSPAVADTPPANFSKSRLKALGIDPSTAAYFSQGGRFSPGIHEVELQVNGKPRGLKKVTFGREGTLCADSNFFNSAAISQPSQLAENQPDAHCPPLTLAWPSASINLQPEIQAVGVIVPPEAIVNENSKQHFQRGGVAALLNYSAYNSQFESYGNHSSFSYLSMQNGFNAGDWMVRGAQSLRKGNGSSDFNSAYIYGQKTLVGRKQLLQAGQIAFSNSLLSGAPIDGIQLLPQSALSDKGSGALVEGLAQADQSRVEVHQNGILIYSTLVPAGPFTLRDLPLLNNSSDLQLTVTTPSGQENRSTIAAASYSLRIPQAPETWSLALGRMRSESVSAEYDSPWVASFSDGRVMSQQVLLQYGAIAASDYAASAVGLAYSPLLDLSLGLSGALSQDRNHDRQGVKSSASAIWQAPQNIGLSADITLYSPGYRELSDSVSSSDTPYSRSSAGLRMNWRHAIIGNVSLSASQTREGNNGSSTRWLMASWNRKLGNTDVSVNWQRQSQRIRDCSFSYRCPIADRDNLFVNLNFPLGGQKINSYYRDNNGVSVAGVRTGNNLTENSNWSLAAERNLHQQQYNSLSGNVNGNLHYTTAGLYGAIAENHSRTYSGTLSGGVVAHKEGITFSPHKVNDTFGLVSVTPAISGVEITTPQGKVWTDWQGMAVVPSLPPYGIGKIALNTERLPENIDVSNGLQQVVAGHGAVTHSRFALQKTRNGLLRVHMEDGIPLPKGSAIMTADGNYVTTAVDAGTVFISDLDDVRPLFAHWQNKRCRLSYQVPKNSQKNIAYETLNATCKT